jgi:hypothetical protein
MSIKVFITIDTEEDLWDNWKRRDNPVENISRIPLLQELFDHYGAIPTYFVNYPVITNKYSSRIIREIYDKGSCEIGTHIHPWNTPPFEETICAKNSFICNLPRELAKRKLLNLHNKIKDHIGMEPKCFRAGRWGFGPTIASCIHELGYLTDTSITPFCDWTEEEGPDFTDASYLPYRFEPNDVLSKNSNGRLLEIPPTIGFFQQNFGRCAEARKWILGSRLSRYHLLEILDRLRIINFRLLSPEMSSGSNMIKLAKSFIKKGYAFLNMFFHSTSLLPGCSPFVKNENELEAFIGRIEMFLQFASEKSFEFAPLSDALEGFNGGK